MDIRDDTDTLLDTIRVNSMQRERALILVADHAASMIEYITSLINEYYDVISANNGKEALQLINTRHPDLVIMDVTMPDMDGHQFIKQMKKDLHLSFIPVLMITEKVSEEFVMSGMQIGADDFLTKPFSAEELKARINSNLRSYRQFLLLNEANSHLKNEIAERKHAETKVYELNEQIIIAARRAGMMDVATNVIHNIGNVLNSLNASSAMLSDRIKNLDWSKITRLLEMIKKDDCKPDKELLKNISEYLAMVLAVWESDKTYLQDKVELLNKHIAHIREIVQLQQNLSGQLGFVQQTDIEKLIEDALEFNKLLYTKAKVNIVRDFRLKNSVTVDRVKLLQIVVNLVKNSIESLVESGVENKEITVSTKQMGENRFVIQIQDNGNGILPENITRIFSHGFSTKKNGHGFGLHSSALSAQDMGGSLTADSDGINQGAKFTLILPLTATQ